MAPLLRLPTPSRHGHSIQFSPFRPGWIACAAAQHYGIAGRGTLYVIQVDDPCQPRILEWNWNDCLFDVSWSEDNENVLVTAGGDGFIQVFDIGTAQRPIMSVKAHDREVYSVAWSQERTNTHMAVTASWDTCIKVWDVAAGCRPVAAVKAHDSYVYSAIWSPLIQGALASVAGDGSLRIWDIRDLAKPKMVLDEAHACDILSCDWCKYDNHIMATAGSDGLIRVWDLRNLGRKQPVCELSGHRYAVRRLKFSPFEKGTILSCSYDFRVCLWDYEKHGHSIATMDHHTEFVCGIDFSNHALGQVADCSWDESICVWSTSPLVL